MKQFIKDIEMALYASKICSYAQGFDLMSKASNYQLESKSREYCNALAEWLYHSGTIS